MPEPIDTEGRWITVNGQRIHINRRDEIDAGGHPKLREALEKGGLPAQKPDGTRGDTDFPDPSKVKELKVLGGSTGARLVEAGGVKYVKKRGASPDHVREEEVCNALYRAVGVTVQDSTIFETDAGPVKLARYLDDVVPLRKVMAGPDSDKKTRVLAAIRKDFAADALFGNWDVIGLEYDNVMVTPEGEPVRIDNGGALRYRAMGGRKNDKFPGAWGPTCPDIDTLRGIGRGSKSAQDVFSGLPDGEVAEQVKGLLGKRAAILAAAPDDLRDTIDARLTWLADKFKVAAPPAAAPAAAPKGGSYRGRDLHAEGVWPAPPDRPDGTAGRRSYGGVVFDPEGRVLLREPADHYDGYHWTFAKGGAKPGEDPFDVAHREVSEETGHDVDVVGHVPGRHGSGYSSSYFYLMTSKGQSRPHDAETASLKWATPDEARALIGRSTNARGRARDLNLLAEAVAAHKKLSGAEFSTVAPAVGPAAVVRDAAYWNAVVAFDGVPVTRLELFHAFDATPGMTERAALAVLDAARPV